MNDANLIAALGIDKLPEEEQDAILTEMGQVIFESILARIIPLIRDEDKDEFEKLLGDRSDEGQEKIYTFLYEKIPTLDEIIKEVVEGFREDSMNIMSKIQ